MSWKESDTMSEKFKFVLACSEPGANISNLCVEFDVSRSTGMKWLKRYREEGVSGLLERSRRPHSSPLETSAELVCEIVQLSEAPRSLRASRIQKKLKRKYAPKEVPSLSTIQRVLEKIGRVKKRRNSRANSKAADGKAVANSCNEVWTADFKGWWRTGDRERCEPLTIMDLKSRYLLELQALPNVQTEATKDRFRSCFERYGQPEIIWTDNGVPFASPTGLQGFSKLSVWWLKLGITPKRIPKGKPWCNGVHERMHGDIAREIEVNPSWNRFAQQQRFNDWRLEFNDTPHGALEDKTPSEVYRGSTRSYDPAEPEFNYPDQVQTRKVDQKGFLHFKNTKYFFSKAFSSQIIGLEETEEKTCKVWFCENLIGAAVLADSPLRGKASTSIQHFRWVKQSN